MSLNPNQIVRAGTRSFRVEDYLETGGQGSLFKIRDQSDNTPHVVKILVDNSESNKLRVRHLCQLNLGARNAVLAAPSLCYEENGILGHITPQVENALPLSRFLATKTEMIDRLFMTAALAKALAVLESANLAHGDLHGENLLFTQHGDHWELHLIDFDNYWAPHLPPPAFAGHPCFTPPEIEVDRGQGRVTPNLMTDRYGIALCSHYLLLNSPPFSGLWHSPEDYEAALAGDWPPDPLAGLDDTQLAVSPALYPEALMDLLRRGLGFAPPTRPSPADWLATLRKILTNDLRTHTLCGGACFHSTHLCPDCGAPTLRLHLENNRKIDLHPDQPTFIGRADCADAPAVSARHLEISFLHGKFHARPIGSNPTHVRQPGSDWSPIPNGHWVALTPGQKWELATFQLRVEATN